MEESQVPTDYGEAGATSIAWVQPDRHVTFAAYLLRRREAEQSFDLEIGGRFGGSPARHRHQVVSAFVKE
jgi:hypothetical protein